ncbi:MAG: insulinase family protein [Cyanobacteria bacterium TGS_CYA1]|nr:insulinase family protein [Cyanobacteria bacterium TGS_CYA1]
MRARLFALFLSVLTVLIAMPILQAHGQETQLAPPTHVHNDHIVIDGHLKNGLKVILLPEQSYPAVSCQLWFHTGSRNDPPGLNGLSHVIEHMIQNRMQQDKDGLAQRLIECGAKFSASTSDDFTLFVENLACENLNVAIAALPKFLNQSPFTDAELKVASKQVVAEIDEQNKQKSRLLDVEMRHLAYRQAGYSNHPAGDTASIEQLEINELNRYFSKHYGPPNATVVLSGNIGAQQNVLGQLDKTIGHISSQHPRPESRFVHPKQNAERRAFLKVATDSPEALIAYQAVSLTSLDAPAFMVLESVLNANNGGVLVNHFLDTKLCSSARVSFEYKRHPGLFLLHLKARSGIELQAVLAELDLMVNTLKDNPLNSENIERAKNQTLFNLQASRTSPFLSAFQLGLFDVTANGQKGTLKDLESKIAKITAQDVRACVQKHFLATNRSIVSLGGRESAESIPNIEDYHPKSITMAGYTPCSFPVNNAMATTSGGGEQTQLTQAISTRKLPNGISLTVLQVKSSPVLEIAGACKAGLAYNPPGKPGLAEVHAQMLNGDSQKISQVKTTELQFMKGLPRRDLIYFNPEKIRLTFRTRAFIEDLESQLKLVFHHLTEPQVNQATVERAKKAVEDSVLAQEKLPEKRLERAILRNCFSAQSALAPDEPAQILKSVQDISEEDINKFHAQYIVPSQTSIVIAGNISMDQASKALSAAVEGHNFSGQSDSKVDVNLKQMAKKVLINTSASRDTMVALGRVYTDSLNNNKLSRLLLANCLMCEHPLYSATAKYFVSDSTLGFRKISSDVSSLDDCSIWKLIVAGPASDTKNLLNLIKQSIADTKFGSPDDARIIKMKEYLNGEICLRKMENMHKLAGAMLDGLTTTGQADAWWQVRKDILQIRPDTVRAYLLQDFVPELSCLVVSSDSKNLKQTRGFNLK